MTPKQLFSELRQYCIDNADEAVVKKYSRYFKEGYDAYGLTQEILYAKADELINDRKIGMGLVIETSYLLLETGKYEETSFAITLLKRFKKDFTIEIFEVMERWFSIGMINWGHTDVTCGEIINPLFEAGIITLDSFKHWRTAENTYQRRAVPVSMLWLLKTDISYKFLFEFIDSMMMDKEKKVHQALGWFLREAWKRKPKETEEFLLKWKNDAARVIFQYATEKMSKDYRMKFRKEKRK